MRAKYLNPAILSAIISYCRFACQETHVDTPGETEKRIRIEITLGLRSRIKVSDERKGREMDAYPTTAVNPRYRAALELAMLREEVKKEKHRC